MENILNLILKGESETREFKKSTSSLREGIETLCAFANHKGGYLILGVEDSGEIIGQQVSDDTLKNKAGKPSPEFFYEGGMFRLELYRSHLQRRWRRTPFLYYSIFWTQTSQYSLFSSSYK